MIDLFTVTHAHSNDPDTSFEAAEKAQTFAAKHKAIVLGAFRKCGALTADQVAQVTGLELYQARRRVTDLKNDGAIADTGLRRKTPTGRRAVVWDVTSGGRV